MPTFPELRVDDLTSPFSYLTAGVDQDQSGFQPSEDFTAPPRVVALVGGGYVVVYGKYNLNAGDWNLYVQRFDASGARVGSETLIAASGAFQYEPHIAALADGGFTVAYTQNGVGPNGSGAFVRTFNADGSARTGEVRADTVSGNYWTEYYDLDNPGFQPDQDMANPPQVIALTGGGFVAVYGKYTNDGAQWNVCVQRFGADGLAVGSEITISAPGIYQIDAQATALIDGGFVIMWTSADGGISPAQSGVFATVFEADGSVRASAVRVDNPAIGGSYVTVYSDLDNSGIQAGEDYGSPPQIVALQGGGFVVVYGKYTSGNGWSVHAQTFTANGVKVGGELAVSSTGALEFEPEVTALNDGGFAVVWSVEGIAPYSAGVMTRIYNADGTARTGEIRVEDTTTPNHFTQYPDADNLNYQPVQDLDSRPQIVTLDNGKFVVVYGKYVLSSQQWDLFAQVFNADGTKDGGEITVADGAAQQFEPVITALENGAFAIAWSVPGVASSGGGVFTQMFEANDAANAQNDAVSVGEDATLNGDVFANNGSSADADPNGDDLSVTEVNGESADVGVQITLASGALLTVNADGTFSYDPNGQFNHLTADETATDSFTYTASDPGGETDTATVTITINGADEATPQPFFDFSPTAIGAPNFPHSLATAIVPIDLDLDGDLDLIVAWVGDTIDVDGEVVGPETPLQFFLNDGNANWTDATATFFPGGAPLSQITHMSFYADFNGDGYTDIYMPDHGPEQGPLWPGGPGIMLYSTGPTGFAHAVGVVPGPHATHDVAVGDIDGDGDIDMFRTAGGGGHETELLINDGNGNFTIDNTRLPFVSTNIFDPANPYGIPSSITAALVDVDGDDDLDLVLPTTHPGAMPHPSLVLRNDGTGHFEYGDNPVLPFMVEPLDTVVDMATADLDSDGDIDLVLSGIVDNNYEGPTTIGVYTNDGAGNFTLEMIDPGGVTGSALLNIADVNNDGHLDIIGDGGTRIFAISDGAGGYINVGDLTGWGSFFVRFTAADLNNDGRTDFIGFNGTLGGIRVMLGQNQPLTHNGDGASNSFLGDDSAEALNGAAGDDFLFGGAGADTLNGGADDDYMNGGAGIDTAIFSGASTAATWTRNANGSWTITADGEDTVHFVEYLQFTDRTVFLDSAATNFFNNGTSDILLRNSAGITAIWALSASGAVTFAAPTQWQAPSGWEIQGVGDLNADGRDDLLLRRTDGVTAVWSMNGVNVTAADVTLWQADNTWQIQDVGDFNGDGSDDILWRRDDGVTSIWQMNGTNVIAADVTLWQAGNDWQIQGTGDFDGDGREDFLWRRDDGTLAIWHMNGANVESADVLSQQAGLEWSIAGIGDFDGDGRDDIVLQRDGDRYTAIFTMDGTSVVNASLTSTQAGAEWSIAAVGDYNGDGRDDILIRRDADGILAVWTTDGATVTSADLTSQQAGADWGVI